MLALPNAPIAIIYIINLPYSHVTDLWLAAATERKTLGGACLLIHCRSSRSAGEPRLAKRQTQPSSALRGIAGWCKNTRCFGVATLPRGPGGVHRKMRIDQAVNIEDLHRM